MGLSLLVIQRSGRDIKNYYSNTQEVDLGWLRYLILSIIFLLIFVLIARLLDFWDLYATGMNFEIFSFIGLSIWIFILGYYGLKKVPVFSIFPSTVPRAKYAKTRIDDHPGARICGQTLQAHGRRMTIP